MTVAEFEMDACSQDPRYAASWSFNTHPKEIEALGAWLAKQPGPGAHGHSECAS
jgi:hypothetical protein